MASDVDLLFDSLKNEIAFLKQSWRILSRPVVVIRLGSDLIEKEFDQLPRLIIVVRKSVSFKLKCLIYHTNSRKQTSENIFKVEI